MKDELICPVCGKPINVSSEEFEYIKGGICDASGMTYVHTACVRQSITQRRVNELARRLRNDKR